MPALMIDDRQGITASWAIFQRHTSPIAGFGAIASSAFVTPAKAASAPSAAPIIVFVRLFLSSSGKSFPILGDDKGRDREHEPGEPVAQSLGFDVVSELSARQHPHDR